MGGRVCPREYVFQAPGLDLGNVDQAEMLRTFNMGIGLIVAVPARSAARARRVLDEMNQPTYEIGVVAKGRRRVVYQ